MMDASTSSRKKSRSMQVKIGILVSSAVAFFCGWVWTACLGGAMYVWLAHDVKHVELCEVGREDDNLREVESKDDSKILLKHSTRDLTQSCIVQPKKKRKGLRHKLTRIFRRRKKRDVRGASGQHSVVEGDDAVSLTSVDKDTEWFLSPQSFPETTVEERTRFLRARKGDVQAASAMLKNYLDWRVQFDDDKRQEHTLGMNDSDTSKEDLIWNNACILASSISPSPLSSSDPIPPCIVFFPERDGSPNNTPEALRTLKGKRVLQHIPARIDLSAADAEVYATALALYIDRLVPHDSIEKICVVIDARPGNGWSNIPAPLLVPFIKHAARLLNDLHPERLDSCILFPVPVVAKYLWNVVRYVMNAPHLGTSHRHYLIYSASNNRPFLDPSTANRIQLITGWAGVKSPVPKDLELYLEKESIEWMEGKRLSLFVEPQKK